MLLGIPLAAAAVNLIAVSAMNFTVIHHDKKTRQASGAGRSWDFIFFILIAVFVLQSFFLPFHIIQTWGIFIINGVLVLINLYVNLKQYDVECIYFQHQVIHSNLNLH